MILKVVLLFSAELFGLENLSTTFGVVEFGRGLGSFCGTLLIGLLFDAFGSYHWPFIVSGLMLVTSAICGQAAHMIFIWRRRTNDSTI